MSNLYRGPSIDALESPVVIAHFIPIRLQKWPPQAILVSEWPIFENLLL
jgi:hypothetical protein